MKIPAIVFPLHRSLSGYLVVAYSDAATNSEHIIDGDAYDKHLMFFNTARMYRKRGNDLYLLVRGDEAMAWNQPATDEGPDGARQTVLPGAERATIGATLQRRADAPLKPRKAQAACDAGLFSDARNQQSLF